VLHVAIYVTSQAINQTFMMATMNVDNIHK